MDVPKLIRDARWSAELSQRELAERAGVSRYALSHYESGKRTPSLATLRKVLAAVSKQIHAGLEPLDADIKRAIAEIAERPVDERPGVRLWCCLGDQVAEFNYRVEGLAAASILGAPVPVDTFELALADEERTFEWLSGVMMRWAGAAPRDRGHRPAGGTDARYAPRSGPGRRRRPARHRHVAGPSAPDAADAGTLAAGM